jgi:predicted nucleic acid-binding protein
MLSWRKCAASGIARWAFKHMGSFTSAAQPLLLDTNILIYHLKRGLSVEFTEQLALTIVAQQAYISLITRIEMLAWKGHTDLSLQQTTELLDQLPELGINEAVIAQTIHVRKTYSLKLPDALIAATALVHGLQLVTANTDDFKRVDSLAMHGI